MSLIIFILQRLSTLNTNEMHVPELIDQRWERGAQGGFQELCARGAFQFQSGKEKQVPGTGSCRPAEMGKGVQVVDMVWESPLRRKLRIHLAQNQWFRKSAVEGGWWKELVESEGASEGGQAVAGLEYKANVHQQLRCQRWPHCSTTSISVGQPSTVRCSLQRRGWQVIDLWPGVGYTQLEPWIGYNLSLVTLFR